MSIKMTSQLLEEKVDFDRPILLVGPGLMTSGYDDNRFLPMDTALIWFAERLHQRKGRLDILDLPSNSNQGGHHNLDLLMMYLRSLSLFAPLGELRPILGDITQIDLPKRGYGTIWDHGTYGWVHSPNLLWIYQELLQGSGTAIISCHHSETISSQSSMNHQEVLVEEDKYALRMSGRQLYLGITPSPSLFKDGCVYPSRNYQKVYVFTKE